MPIPKWLQWLSNATIKASIAGDPAVATASGWTINNGEAQQNATEDPGVQQLRENLAVISSIPLTDVATEAFVAIPTVEKVGVALQGLVKNWKAAKTSGKPLKWIWNNGKIIQESIPESVVNPDSWYRIVDDTFRNGAIKDAQTAGVIRTNDVSIFKSPMFRKGEPYWPLNGSKFNNTKSAVIVSKPGAQVEWRAVDNMGELLDLNSQRIRDALGRTPTMEELIHTNNSVGTPTINGVLNSAPSKEFTFWRKYPKIGWRELSFKTGGILSAQHGSKILDFWQKAYDSKFGKGLRDFMYGQDHDLSDEEYMQKYGHARPIGGLGAPTMLLAPEWEGLEIPEITSMHYGLSGIPRGISAVETERFIEIPQKTKIVKSITKTKEPYSKAFKAAFKERTGFDIESAPKVMQERELEEWNKYIDRLRKGHKRQ